MMEYHPQRLDLNYKLTNSVTILLDHYNPSDKDFFYSLINIDKFWKENYPINHSKLISNNNHIFVLVNAYTASAAEMFINLLRGLENVVIIGTNTRGALLNSGTFVMELPFSGIDIQYGSDLNLWDKEVFREGVGFTPDLWIGEEDALNSTIKLIKYYGLK